MKSLRRRRQVDLSSSDWTQAADSPLSDAKKAEWATYRQQLRDLPANTTDPANPTCTTNIAGCHSGETRIWGAGGATHPVDDSYRAGAASFRRRAR